MSDLVPDIAECHQGAHSLMAHVSTLGSEEGSQACATMPHRHIT